MANTKELSKLKEVTRGMFDEPALRCLLRINGNDPKMVLQFISTKSFMEVIETVKNEIENYAPKINSIDPSRLGDVKKGRFPTVCRQFACESCDHFWWKRVPKAKQVSKCNLCQVKFDPVPRDKEWGWAQFHCPYCKKDFSGYSQMGVHSKCYSCNNIVLPSCIKPPNYSKYRNRKTSSRHSCEGCSDERHGHGVAHFGNAQRRPARDHAETHQIEEDDKQGGLRGQIQGQQRNAVGYVHTYSRDDRGQGRSRNKPRCAHPQNIAKKVLFASDVHVSSGSTVATFLSQEDLAREFEVMSVIAEERSLSPTGSH